MFIELEDIKVGDHEKVLVLSKLVLTRGKLKLTGVLSDTLLVFAKPWQWGFREHHINFP
jgi:hypothetical protein